MRIWVLQNKELPMGRQRRAYEDRVGRHNWIVIVIFTAYDHWLLPSGHV
jgi:hypothetical protein